MTILTENDVLNQESPLDEFLSKRNRLARRIDFCRRKNIMLSERKHGITMDTDEIIWLDDKEINRQIKVIDDLIFSGKAYDQGD